MAVEGSKELVKLVSELEALGEVDFQPGMAIVCLVGEDIRGRIGIASEVFGVLAASDINIRMIAQGSTEISVSFVVDEKDAVKSVQQLHRHLFELPLPRPRLFRREPRAKPRKHNFFRHTDWRNRLATTTAFDQASRAQAPALKVAILGFGTVGSAVARILCDQPAHSPLRLTHVFNRNVERKRVDWVADDVCWSSDVEQVLASDADIIVELVGGVDPAHDWISRALASGKSVVTANKKLIAQHGPHLSEIARQHGGAISFGASVAGGVPVIDALQEGLAGDQLYKVCGILNGTCNYILTKLEREGISFEAALTQAQGAGFAEADPTDDVDGYDARAKLVILTRIGLKAIVQPEQIPCTSIRSLGAVDFTYAHELGCTIRQISRARAPRRTYLRFGATGAGSD